jgi:hypothetical protein
MSLRICYHGLVFAAILGLAVPLAAGKTPRASIRVAVFQGLGADPECLSDAMEALNIDPAIRPEAIRAADIVRGRLKGFAALVFPGGSGMGQMSSLGSLGQKIVADFIRQGGHGAVGLCAGCYMLSDTPDYPCFHLGGMAAIDREHDERGHGMVRFSPTPDALRVFPEFQGAESLYMQYYEGPVLVPAPSSQATSLAVLRSDVHLEHDAPANLTPGKTFLAWADAGKGRVFLEPGHPENTPGLRWMLPRMVRWTLRRNLVPYGPAVVRLTRNRAEVLFDAGLRQKERGCFDELVSEPGKGSGARKVAAIAALLEMRSWGAKERLPGCLRDEAAAVRIAAAEALVDLEHTAARRDLENALAIERDPAARAVLQRCARSLSGITQGR